MVLITLSKFRERIRQARDSGPSQPGVEPRRCIVSCFYRHIIGTLPSPIQMQSTSRRFVCVVF
ncbi:hypothetical protein GBA52_012045 [Prunus armeniaca]|nr:hypothetical protein GBA52_012045 [Prunus armeniaca]